MAPLTTTTHDEHSELWATLAADGYQPVAARATADSAGTGTVAPWHGLGGGQAVCDESAIGAATLRLVIATRSHPSSTTWKFKLATGRRNSLAKLRVFTASF